MPKTATEKHYYASRSEMPKEHQWQLQKMYRTIAEWEKHYKQAHAEIKPLSVYRGKLKTPTKILAYFKAASAVIRQIEKLYVFASHGSAVDLSNHHLQVLTQKAQNIYTEFSQTVSFQGPELSKLPESMLKKMIASKEFHPYHRELRLVLAKKKHILSDAEEAILSQASKIMTGPDDIFSALDDVDLTFSDVTNEKGEIMKLTNGNFITFLENPDRQVRQNVFETYYKSYQSHIHTFAQTLNLAVKQHHFYAKAKKYKSCLEASLSGNMIDPKVYQTLLTETHHSLPVLYKYMAFRAKKLGLKKINMWDMRVNLMNAKPLAFHFC